MQAHRSRLFPWFVGVGIVAAFELFVALTYFGPACPAPGFVQILILVVLPAIYLALMFLTLKSQP